MRIALAYSVGAGDGLSISDLRAACAAAGHEIAVELDHDDGVGQIPTLDVDAVVVAGGDGSVGATLRAWAGREVPVAILPYGTANNIARALGLPLRSTDVLKRLDHRPRLAFDLGLLQATDVGRRPFCEGVGLGLVPRGIEDLIAEDVAMRDQTVEERLDRALQAFAERLSRMQPIPGAVVVDGAVVAEEFLLVEVLNICGVGSRLDLAPDATSSDGLLDVVVAGERDRDVLMAYLRKRREGRTPAIDLPRWRGKQVEVRGEGPAHVDDQLAVQDGQASLVAHVWPAAIEVIV